VNGVIYVAYGERARREALMSIGLLRRHSWLPACVIGPACDRTFWGTRRRDVHHIAFTDHHPGARWAKLHFNILSPYSQTLYLDADTRPYQDVSVGFQALADGWDVAMAPSSQQDDAFLWHCSEADREAAMAPYWMRPLALQAGVMFVRRCEATDALFEAWREEWQVYRDQDQGALLRALARVPVRMWLLGREWNGGMIIGHQFGMAARRR